MRKLIVTAALVLAAALALPNPSSAAPPPPPPTTQDAVLLTVTGVPALVYSLGAPVFDLLAINATSSPNGEDPTGQVRFDLVDAPRFQLGGPVTCLAVSGSTATINFQDQMGLAGIIITARAVDGQPDTFTAAPVGRVPTDCSPPPPLTGGPLAAGDITVVDGEPLPTTKQQCKNGGWGRFGFKNQGQCIAFVNNRRFLN